MMTVITKKMLLMTAFVTVKMLMMAANVNDGCNQLLMMAVIIMKIFFFQMGFNMRTDCWLVKVVLLSYCWSVILIFYRPTEGRQNGGVSGKVLPMPFTTTHIEGR
jgi:hypothetical protein